MSQTLRVCDHCYYQTAEPGWIEDVPDHLGLRYPRIGVGPPSGAIPTCQICKLMRDPDDLTVRAVALVGNMVLEAIRSLKTAETRQNPEKGPKTNPPSVKWP